MERRDDRRQFLKTGLAAGTMVGAAGLEGILAARRAPAFAQTTKIHLLQWVDFIPEGDVEVRRQVAEYTKQTKVEVVFETINANDLQARITAAIQSGAGPDLILMLHNWPHLYANALVDVTDLSDWKTKDQGGYYSHCDVAARSTSTGRSGPRSRRRAGRSARPSATPSATPPHGPTRSCGRSGGPRPTPPAARWCSTARARSRR